MSAIKALGLCLALASLTAEPSQAQARPKSDDQCLGQGEVRELVNQNAVLSPELVLRKARATVGPGAKVLRALLCRREGQYVYRLTLLRRDGRVIHQVVSARPVRPDAPR
ncbi:PepSY domain-containing protein [Camelimonas sp. ID_303_24]